MYDYSSAFMVPPQISKPFLRKVDFWVQNSGLEWTVSMLKIIYTDYIRYRARKEPVGKWYKRTSGGLPSVASALFKYSNRGKKQCFAVTQLLRVYTIFVSNSPTEKQLSKFLDGVNADVIPVPTDITAGLVKAASMCCDRVKLDILPRPYIMYVPSPSKRVPHFDGKTYPEDEYWNSQYLTLKLTYTGQILRHRYPEIFKGVLEHLEDTTQFVGRKPPTPDTVGSIGLIQEPGYKLRAVANPNRIYQMCLEPLGDCLYNTIRSFDWDCTHNQSKAHPVIQDKLRCGTTVHCIDLSGATDYFPLSLQISTLKRFIHDPYGYINLFGELSRSSWNFLGNKLSWKKGQPLGLYPSFASFALTHGLLLFYLNNFSHNNDFFYSG
jgi:hypothetical protein